MPAACQNGAESADGPGERASRFRFLIRDRARQFTDGEVVKSSMVAAGAKAQLGKDWLAGVSPTALRRSFTGRTPARLVRRCRGRRRG